MIIMAIELQRLVEKAAHMDVTLLAGKNGIHNPVTWVTYGRNHVGL